jgi:hypothetical protein
MEKTMLNGVLSTLFLTSLLYCSAALSDCPCGPTYCLDTSEYLKALAKKKQSLSKEYPARLVAILDRASHCEACITKGPDGFSLLIQDVDGDIQIDHWDSDNERIGAKQAADGKIKACRVIWVREAFACCHEKPAEQRSDWDGALKLSSNMSVRCSSDQ